MKVSRSVFTALCILSLLGSVQTTQAFASTAAKDAVDAYNREKYDDALSRFQEALVESPDDPAARFNLASAQYQTGNFSEAAKGFEDVVSRSKNAALKQKALYNLGNTSFRQGNLQASADYYRKALDLNPVDTDAKQNLEFALQALEKQQQQKKNDKGQQGNEKNKEQQRPGEQNKQKDAKKDQQPSKEKQQGSKSGNKEQDASSHASGEKERHDESGELKEAGAPGDRHEAARADAKPDPKALAPDEAERLFNTLSDDQRTFVREQAKRFAPRTKSGSKDW